jgi:FkbM family methyltransferase
MNKLFIILFLLIIILIIYIKKYREERFTNNFPECLTVYDSNNKIRLGNNGDGGYVIHHIDNQDNQDNQENIYDCYISCGVSNEESFSRDFIKKYNMNKNNSYAFDGTIEDYPYQYTKDITYIKKNIGNKNDNKTTNLDFLFEKYNNIFLKMDIEGWEYEWLLQITPDKLEKIKQIALEVHGINDDSWNFKQKDKIDCFNKLNEKFYLIHLHGNNFGGISNNMPNVLELTYLNKNAINYIPEKNKKQIPSSLDYPNCTTLDDYKLNSPPFVN